MYLLSSHVGLNACNGNGAIARPSSWLTERIDIHLDGKHTLFLWSAPQSYFNFSAGRQERVLS